MRKYPNPDEWWPIPRSEVFPGVGLRKFSLPKIWGDWRENGLYERYPGFNMLYLPALENLEPLEVLLSLERLDEIMSGMSDVNCMVDFAKYYWRVGGGDP